jgi:hypothetical protein
MFNTVAGHIEDGTVSPKVKKSVDDLELAATWLESYEADADEDMDMIQSLATTAAWLRRLAEKR